MTIKPVIILRQLRRSPKQATVLVLCVMLSIVTLAAITDFADNLRQTLLRDARRLHGADILIRSHEALSPGLKETLDQARAENRIRLSTYYGFYSVVRTADNGNSLLADLKVVDGQYPVYGEVGLLSGRPFREVLGPGRAVAQQSLLDRLGLRVGDKLKAGYTTLVLADVVTSEPDRPVDLFSLGPRLFVSNRDLDALGLLRTGGHIHHVQLVKVMNPAERDTLVGLFKKAAGDSRERIDTFETARSGIKRFLDNFLFFLRLIGVFILILAGVGIQGSLTAFLKEKERSIAIMKTVGATNRSIATHFAAIVGLLGLGGILLGIGVGHLVQRLLSRLLVSFLPPGTLLTFSWRGALEAFVLGTAVVFIFSFIPLYRLSGMRPLAIFRKDKARRPPKRLIAVTGGAMILFVALLAMRQLQSVRLGLYVTAGVIALILVTGLLTHLLLAGLKHLRLKHLVARQSVRGLFRNGNATRSVVITLTASLSVIFSIFLIEENLKATFIDAFPADTPNLFFIDIQPSQKEGFTREIGRPMRFHPVVRARVAAINGHPIDPEEERSRRGDNFSRMFNLTYREDLLEDERLLQGSRLFRSDWEEPQVSILDTVAEMKPMAVGDHVTFNIQGVPLKVRVSSIRTRSKEDIRPFFYFVLETKTLKDAPQTLFAAIQAAPETVGPLQTRISARFPNITSIDLSETFRVFGAMMKKLSVVVRLLSLLSIAAGLLILISAIFATRIERLIESVYFKTLGAGQGFVILLNVLENGLIALLSVLLAMGMAQTTAALVCRHGMEIPYRANIAAGALAGAGILVLVIAVGLVTTWPILIKKPVVYLREQPDG